MLTFLCSDVRCFFCYPIHHPSFTSNVTPAPVRMLTCQTFILASVR